MPTINNHRPDATGRFATAELGEASGIANVAKTMPTYADGRAQAQHVTAMSRYMRRTLIPIGGAVLVFGMVLGVSSMIRQHAKNAAVQSQQQSQVQKPADIQPRK
jgi:hypothetical protein